MSFLDKIWERQIRKRERQIRVQVDYFFLSWVRKKNGTFVKGCFFTQFRRKAVFCFFPSDPAQKKKLSLHTNLTFPFANLTIVFEKRGYST